MGETKLEREIRRHQRELRRAVGRNVRELREDAALTRSAVASAAGIDRSFEGRVEEGEREPSLSTLAAIATVLGADLSVRLYPTTGPRIRDRVQAAMVEALIVGLHPRWTASPEVPVHQPARGVIDVVLSDSLAPIVVATEVHSELRRLEQQVRWHREKAESLPSADEWRFLSASAPATISRLLVLRSTRAMREVAVSFGATLGAAYPAPMRQAIEALTGSTARWPDAAIVWVVVEQGRGRLMDGPPRGVRLGR